MAFEQRQGGGDKEGDGDHIPSFYLAIAQIDAGYYACTYRHIEVATTFRGGAPGQVGQAMA